MIYDRYGATSTDFAEIARISHLHSSQNPYAQFRDIFTLPEILSSPSIFPPLTKLQCSPTSDGGASAIVVSQSFLDSHPELKDQAIEIAGQHLATDAPTQFNRSAIDLVGYDATKHAAEHAMAEASVSPKDVTLCELHDCFSTNELITLDALGLCDKGKAHEMVRKGDITYGGRVVVNPSGGLISKGHPLGATGIAQCAEIVWQLRGWANTRLVEASKWGLQHNLGLGGAAVVSVYKRSDGKENKRIEDEQVARVSGLGYNPATEAKGFTKEQVERIRSRTYRSEWALGDVQGKVLARF